LTTDAATRSPGEKRPGRRPAIGYLLAPGQTRPLACPLREYGSASAVISISGWLAIPETFILYVEPDGMRHDCRVAERRGANVSVELLSAVREMRPRVRATL
jgi:hypothetical protein